ncbi:MAG TPA: hypothetical protein PKL13_04695 [bacterium]|nr:hypothetical protein [bacterium]
MSKEHKDLIQIYNGYRIKVVHDYLTKKYNASISSVSKDVESVFEKTVVEESGDAKNAFKKARQIINQHGWEFILEKNENKLMIRLCFDDSDDPWEYEIKNTVEIFSGKKPTKEEAISCGIDLIENTWKCVVTYFKRKIYIVHRNDKYLCRVDEQILNQEFEDFLSAITSGLKIADNKK